MRHLSLWTALCLPALLGAVLGGCQNGNKPYLTAERLDRGLVVILPGIEGESPFNREIRQGLEMAGVYCAMPIYHWGRPIPIAGPLINQVDVLGNRMAAERIAQMIVDYRATRPGRPVYLVGHSGGGGMAVLAAQRLPAWCPVDGLVLLSASISADHDLTSALRNSRQGIVNFFSRSDVGLLVVGTTLAGNVDGARGPGAGAYGFELPKPTAPPDVQRAYGKLYQIAMDDSSQLGFLRAHTSSTRWEFVAEQVAPWICSETWPPPGASPTSTPAKSPKVEQKQSGPMPTSLPGKSPADPAKAAEP